MQALNRAIGDADMFRKMMEKIDAPAQAAPRNISSEVAEWNARVDRENFEKARAKMERRSLQERMDATKP